MPRHLPRLLLLSLTLGLGTTVAIAWASALFMSYPGSATAVIGSHDRGGYELWSITESKHSFGRRYGSFVGQRSGLFTADPQPQLTTFPVGVSLPRWAGSPIPPPRSVDPLLPNPAPVGYRHVVDARGWPLPALLFRHEIRGFGAAASATTVGGFPLPPLPSAPNDPRALPYTPIWPTLAADTALFTLLWLVLLPLPAAVRRHLRRRAGRCPSCAYDLRAITAPLCPECGAPRPTAQSAALAPLTISPQEHGRSSG